MLRWMDLAEDERKERFKNRYIDFHNRHVQDIKNDHINEERKLNKMSLERFQYLERGHDLVTNERYNMATHSGVVRGQERKGKATYLPYSHKTPTAWERSRMGTLRATPGDTADVSLGGRGGLGKQNEGKYNPNASATSAVLSMS